LLDRAEKRSTDSAKASADFFKGDILPASAMKMMVDANDGQPFPDKITFPNVAQDAWTTKGLTGGLWKNGVPKFSVLWMSDPDYTQHDTSPGSPESLGALESIDRNLAVVLQTLEEKKLREKTDVFVVSDHGFSTVERSVDVADLLKQAGFHAAKKLTNPQPGDIMVIGLGGSVSLYVIGHDETIIRKLVEFFQASDFAGVIFSHLAIEGTFPLEQVRVASANAPDVLVSLRWNAKTNAFGAPGMFAGDTNKKGAHGSLSPFDMHNTLAAAGPDFRRGFKDTLPTGNIDLAPTILWILGLQPPQKMDGRILSEAVNGLEAPKSKPEQKTLEAANDSGNLHWRQYLKTSSVGDTIYFDEGNAVK
jgi:arylsulfatase A-like enzyme